MGEGGRGEGQSLARKPQSASSDGSLSPAVPRRKLGRLQVLSVTVDGTIVLPGLSLYLVHHCEGSGVAQGSELVAEWPAPGGQQWCLRAPRKSQGSSAWTGGMGLAGNQRCFEPKEK